MARTNDKDKHITMSKNGSIKSNGYAAASEMMPIEKYKRCVSEDYEIIQKKTESL